LCAQDRERGRDRHDLGDGNPVEPVHEIDEVDEPQPCQHEEAAFDPDRNERRNAQAAGTGEHDCSDGNGLQQKPRQDRNRFEVVGEAERRDEQGRTEQRDREVRSDVCDAGDRDACNDKRRRNHGNAGALRGRNAVR
jgi:hypothetical protein